MSELGDLIEAAKLAPGKNGLARAVLRAAKDAVDPDDAVVWLTEGVIPGYDSDTRAAIAAFLVEADEGEAALAWAAGAEPVLVLARARAFVSLDRLGEAAEHYSAAIKADPTLASDELQAVLTARHARGSDKVVDLRGRRVEQTVPPAGLSAREARTFADVGGLAEVKKEIHRKIILPFQKPALFDRFKKKSGGGVLLYGPPGCGKTMMARATAGEVGAAFVSIEITEILDMYIGQSEKRLAQAFNTARASPPTVLFFDEIEALAARRKFGEAEHGASLVSTFLNEFDGVNSDNTGLLILAATNVPWAIDSAFRRPGRFDRVLFVPPPDKDAREAILKLALAERPQETLSLDPIVAATSGFSGADLVGVVETACDLAIEESLDTEEVVPLKQKHVTEALKGLRPTTLEWLSQARNYAKYANESGLYDDVLAFLDKHSK